MNFPGSRIKTMNQTITEQLGRANGLVMVVCRTHSRRMAVHCAVIGASTKLGCPLYFASLCFFVSFYQIWKKKEWIKNITRGWAATVKEGNRLWLAVWCKNYGRRVSSSIKRETTARQRVGHISTQTCQHTYTDTMILSASQFTSSLSTRTIVTGRAGSRHLFLSAPLL